MAAQVLLNSIVTGSIYALIAFGFTLIYGTMNFFNMGFGATVMAGAYSFYTFYQVLHLPLLLAAALACAFTAVLMIGVDRICYYGFRQKRVPGWSGVAASMAVGILLQAVVTMLFGSKSRNVYNGIPASFEVAGAHITTVQIITFLGSIAIVVAATLFLQKTRVGKLIRAIANDKVMARVVGIDVERVYVAIIIVSSVLATVAGVMMGLNTDIRPTIASTSLLKGIVASSVGGAGNIKGALLVGLLIGVLENIAVLFLGSGWRDAVPLVLVVVFLLLKPAAFGIEEK